MWNLKLVFLFPQWLSNAPAKKIKKPLRNWWNVRDERRISEINKVLIQFCRNLTPCLHLLRIHHETMKHERRNSSRWLNSRLPNKPKVWACKLNFDAARGFHMLQLTIECKRDEIVVGPDFSLHHRLECTWSAATDGSTHNFSTGDLINHLKGNLEMLWKNKPANNLGRVRQWWNKMDLKSLLSLWIYFCYQKSCGFSTRFLVT